MHELLLRRALASFLGQELTPEVAADVCAKALAPPLPLPVQRKPGLDVSQDFQHFRFINEALQSSYNSHNSVVMAQLGEGGQIRCVVAFSDWRRWSVEVAWASDGSKHWLTRGLLRCIFSYPFFQLGVRRITARVEEDNVASMRTVEGLGFVREGRMRQQFGDHDCIVYGMLRHECRWIKE